MKTKLATLVLALSCAAGALVFGPAPSASAQADEPSLLKRTIFYIYKVRGLTGETNPSQYPDSHFLDKNPGECEIKVLRKGDLARSLKFTVGPEGRVVDNGVVKQNKIGGIRMLVPDKVIGTGDGQWDPNAWKTDAFYGNPLAGFTAAP